MTVEYDPSNIFARILGGEIPAKFLYEDDHTVAFADIAPQAPVHVLIIPRGAYVSFADFSARASGDEIVSFTRAIGAIARQLGIEDSGYRLISNVGPDSGQEVPHFHVHLLGGQKIGPLISK